MSDGPLSGVTLAPGTPWRIARLTGGSGDGRAHAHSYYDIPVIDGAGARVLAHRIPIEGRDPGPDDAVEVGIAHLERPGDWAALGPSTAWSWQQGPLAQWVGGGPWLTFADREAGRLIGRLVNAETGERRVTSRPLYAVDPAGRFGLALDMGRIDALRPGYGFAEDIDVPAERAPPDAGVWRVDLESGEARLILGLAQAVETLDRAGGLRSRLRRALMQPHYWFNHAKIAPGGERFTVKLRWRKPDGHWDDRQGVSLTASTSGGDLALLADATSHVIWMDDRRLHLWRHGGIEVWEDGAPRGRKTGPFAGGTIRVNAHLRHLAGSRFVWDTPYEETVALNEIDAATGEITPIARFENHRPARGPYRCDLHPVPSADGSQVVVTSLADGRRQVYALSRTEG